MISICSASTATRIADPLGGELRRAHLDDAPHLHHLQRELPFLPAQSAAQRHQLGVEQVPGVRVGNLRALAMTDDDDPLGRQRLHGFAQSQPGDVE